VESKYKVGDRVKILPFLTLCRMGKIEYRSDTSLSCVKFPDGRKFYVSDFKICGGRTGKIVATENAGGPYYYTIAISEGDKKIYFVTKCDLIQSFQMGVVKCEVTEMDVATLKYNAKELVKANRREHNKRATRNFKLKDER